MKLKKLLASILCVAMVLSTMGTVVFASECETLVVGTGDGEYATVDEALEAAADGDTIILSAGEYTPFSVKKSVTIKGEVENGEKLTVIKSLEDKLTQCTLSADTVTLEDIKFTAVNKPRMTYNAILTTYSGTNNLNVINCDFYCTAEDGAEKPNAIYASSGNRQVNLVVEGCTFDGFSKAVYCYSLGNDSDVQISNSVMENCSWAVHVGDTDETGICTIDKCDIDTTYVSFVTGSNAVIKNSDVSANIQVYGNVLLDSNKLNESTVYVSKNGSVTLSQNTGDYVVDNSTSYNGEDSVTVAVAMISNANGTKFYSSIADALAAVKSGDTLTLLTDVTIEAGKGGYSKAGIVQKGFDIDGNGHTLNVTGANDTWGCAIYTNGGTIKNLTIASGMRGVFTAGQTEDIILENVTIDGPIYTISADGASGVKWIIKNSTLNGWTSYTSGFEVVSFENCTFGEGAGYAYMRPYAETTYTGCDFAADYGVDARADVEMTDCSIDGTPMTAEDVAELFGGSVKASIGDKYYTTLEAAIADAEAQGLTNVEIEVFDDFLLSDIVLKNNSSITDLTITGNGDVTMDVEDKLYGLNNKNYVLNNLTVSGMTRWQGDVYFADMGLQSGNVTFNDCTLNGLYTLYQGKFVFDGCVINGETNKYSIMVYASKDVTFTDCVFNSDNKAIKVFGYGTYLENAQVNISGTKFYASATENVKAVVEMDLTQQTNPAVALTIEDSFALGFAEGSETGNVWYNLELPAGKTDENISSVVTDSIAYQCGDITVSFVNAKDENDKDIAGLYNIVLNPADGAEIYEFVGAEFTFWNTSTTSAGADTTMNYEILGIDDVTNTEKSVEKDDVGNYKYALRLVNDAERMSGKDLVIGQVKFHGQGDINFGISEGKVVTTEYGTNLGKYYTKDADDTTDDTLSVVAISGNEIKEVTRKVAVNVAYNLGIDGTYWKDAAENAANQITVTVKDGFGNVKTKDINIADNKGIATFDNVKLGRLTVTLEAPGFRRYVYNTTLEAGADENDALVLNFWNNVKRNEELNGVVVEPLAEIETGKGFMAHNFVVGDIVMDYTVDEYDLAAVTSYYGMYKLTDADKYIKYDLNRDGKIDIIDVHYVLHTLGN